MKAQGPHLSPGTLVLLLLIGIVAAAGQQEPTGYRYGGGGGNSHRPDHGDRRCSCASPEPVPLANGRRRAATASAASSGTAAASEPLSWHHGSSGHDSGYPNRYRPPVSRPALCTALPEAREGDACGAATAVCAKGLCCSQAGTCSRSPEACDGGCQCAFSGIGSRCQGSFPLPTPRPWQLPVAKPGGPCGIYVANCPANSCCSQFGICVPDHSPYCESSSCHSSVSPGSQSCKPRSSTAQRILRHTWTFVWKTLAPDGFARPVIITVDEAGAVFPRLYPNVGDRLIITMINKLNEPMSVHWHGMLQMQTPMMDGVTGVTQRPIPPGGNYTYNFIASTPGTYWWHSHFKTQYGDGLWGLLVVKDPADKTYAVDEVLQILDWYHEVSPPLLQYYLSPASQGNEPTPYTALANIVGQSDCQKPGNGPCSYAYIKGVASSCDAPQMRLRIWNTGVFAPFNVSIDGHRMILVEEDAVKIEPVEVGSLVINTAQRYVVLVCQPTGQPLSNDPVWIRATMINKDLAFPPPYNSSKVILHFTDSKPSPDDLPSGPAVFLPPALNPKLPPGRGVVNPYFLKTYGDIAPPAATRTVPFLIDFFNEPNKNDPNGTLYAHVNQVVLQLQPQSPSLLERISNNPQGMPPPVTPASGFGWNVIDVKRGEVIDIHVRNKSPGEHPLHLHGHWMWVVAAGLPYEGDMRPGHPLDGRLIRDTVTVNIDSFVVLRFVVNNPGLWILHCHIDWHLAAGLGVIIREAM